VLLAGAVATWRRGDVAHYGLSVSYAPPPATCALSLL